MVKKLFANLGVLMTVALVSAAAFAEGAAGEAGQAGTLATGLIAIGSGLAIGLATFGATSGQGRASAAAVEGIARNPGARDKVFMPFILGLVFMELQALLGFVIAFMWYVK